MILNQLVTEFLFKGSTERLEKYNKDLETSKKKLSELKESQKDFNKFFREENIKASDFVSERTKNLQKKLQDIRSKFSYAKRTTHRRYLEQQEKEIQESLNKSKASDEAKFLKARKEQQKVLDQTVKNQKKTSESYQEQIDAQKENIETNKEKTKAEKESMNKAGLALGRFTMALGVASMAVGAVVRAFNYARDTIGKYQESAYGTGVSEEELTQLANVGETMTGVNRNEMLKSISAISTRGARAMGGLDPEFLSTLGNAGLEWYGSFAKSLPIWRELWKAGKLDETRLATVLDPNIFRMITSEQDFETVKARTPYGATREQNQAKMETMGKATEAVRKATTLAGGGRMPDNTESVNSINTGQTPKSGSMPSDTSNINEYTDYTKTQGQPEITWANALKAGGFGGNMTINQNNTYNIHTNNPEVAGKVAGDDINILKTMTLGGDNG